MNRREIVFTLILSLCMGAGLIVVLLSSSDLSLTRESILDQMMSRTPIDRGQLTPTSTTQLEILQTGVVEKTPQPTSTTFPLIEGPERAADIEDVLLLYSSTQSRVHDTNFCKIAEYYGLLCKRVNLYQTALTEEDFKDANGEFYKLVGVSAENLLVNPNLLSPDERDLLVSLIESEGVNLLISDFKALPFSEVLAEMTEGSILGAYQPVDTRKNWIISSESPEITLELTDREFQPNQRETQNDLALYIADSRDVTTLISSLAYDEFPYPIFVRWKLGSGSIFVNGGEIAESLDEVQFIDLLYDYSSFSKVIPTMMTVRYVMGDEAWHREANYANLTIYGVLLKEYAYGFDFDALAQAMEQHHFHTSILSVPVNFDKSEPEIISLIRSDPEHFSLVQQGNNHDGYEFYRYVESEERDENEYPIRPFPDHEADIVEGLSRVQEFSNRTGIETDKVMVFPVGISPRETLMLLKKYNYLASVNKEAVPLDYERPTDWDYGMYPAYMDFGNFPTLVHSHPGTYRPFEPRLQSFLLDLFIEKPALFYSDAERLFQPGMDTFNVVADELNGPHIQAKWHNLEYILTHLYIEKEVDDGSLDLKFFSNRAVITNSSVMDQVYHIYKDEIQNVHITRVEVNGQDFPYRVADKLLMIDIEIPAGATIDIIITYVE